MNTKKTAKEVVKDLWQRACEYDDIPPESSFVVFSKGNPWEGRYNLAVKQYLELCKSVQL